MGLCQRQLAAEDCSCTERSNDYAERAPKQAADSNEVLTKHDNQCQPF